MTTRDLECVCSCYLCVGSVHERCKRSCGPPPWCPECEWDVDTYTHQNCCAVGIVESEDAVEKVRVLLARPKA